MNDSPQPESAPFATEAAPHVAFCQQCGRPLTAETVHRVGTAVFCEPCLAARLGHPMPGAAGQPAGPTPLETHPGLAALLGFIPGVGAMYNGQYAKGFVHLGIFAVLVSLSHLSSIFGLLLTGWVFYQVIDAYQTARARREGTPLPNPFGLNDIGERLGYTTPWQPNSAGAPPYTPAAGQPSAPASPAAAASWTQVPTPPPPASPASTPDWVGYVPPSSFGATAPPPPSAAQQGSTPWGHAPYTPTYTPTYAPPAAAAFVPTAMPPYTGSRLPVGALWLIGIGLVLLLGNQFPDLHLATRWLVPLLLAATAALLLVRRAQTGTLSLLGIRWPAMLAVLAALFALQSADLATLGQTWPVLVIAIGVLLVLERAWPAAPIYPPPAPAVSADASAQAAEAERVRASWSASSDSSAAATPASTPHTSYGEEK